MRALLALAALLMVAPVAQARDAEVRSFDDTSIAVHFFPAKGLAEGERAPTILVGHGWGSYGDTDPEGGEDEVFGGPGPGTFHSAGYNVLTWDARGFGSSGGNAMIDHPGFEGRDAQAILDYVARQPEAQLDGPGDARVGMAGPSYGGGIQWVTAGIDRRVDAITPTISWNSLVRALYREGSIKLGWGSLLGAVAGTSIPLGALSPYGVQTGSLDPPIIETLVSGGATGSFSPSQVAYFDERDIDRVIGGVRVPTLIVQGTADTIFSPIEAMDNFAAMKGRGVPLKMLWFCGGHGLCTGENGPDGYLGKARLAWMDRWLKGDRSVDTGPVFEWLTDTDGKWHSAELFPLPEGTPLRATGSGSLVLSPGSFPTGGGQVIAAGPAEGAFELDLPAAESTLDIVGEPRLRLTYSGTAAPAQTHLYAQLVDTAENRVAGNQVAPVSVTLDGQQHEVELGIEPIAVQLAKGGRLKLQIAGGTTVYYPQRSSGTVELSNVSVTVPTVDASAAPALRVSRVRGVRRARRGRPVRVRVRGVLEGYRDVRLRLARRAGRGWAGVARSRRFAVGTTSKRVRLRVRRRLPAGRYRLRVMARDLYGRRVVVERRARLRRR
jgi:ABC-2 type transport system ATP-binding protein